MQNAERRSFLHFKYIKDEPVSIKNLASYSHRAATTTYPCYIPVLGDSVGAGRIRLARGANVGHGFDMKKEISDIYFFKVNCHQCQSLCKVLSLARATYLFHYF